MTYITVLPVSGPQAVPYYRETAPTGVYATDASEVRRLARIEEAWRFFLGNQWPFVQRSDGTYPVTFNYCRAIVLKKASFLIGKGVTFDVPPVLVNRTKPVIDQVWKDNKQQELLMEEAVTRGVAGDSFMAILHQPPTALERRLNPYTKGKIRLRSLAPHTVFPTYDLLDRDRLVSVRVITKVLNKNNAPPNAPNRGAQGLMRELRYIETYYPDRIEAGWEHEEKVTTPNILGEIPIVHIKNEVFPHETYGVSDLDGIIDLQREFNEKATDLSDVINYHAQPVTIIIGASAKNLQKGANKLWSIPSKDARVSNLTLDSDMGTMNAYLERVKQAMLEISGIPDQALGKAQAVSNTSAAALAIQFQPLVEVVERKAPLVINGLKRVNYFILRYHQAIENVSYPVDLCECCGGRIVDRGGSLKCYRVDDVTLEFENPQDTLIGIRRKLGQGTEYRKVSFRQAKAELEGTKKSFWNIEPEVEETEAVPVVDGGEVPPAQAQTTAPQLPALDEAEMDLPEEPEEVRVISWEWSEQASRFMKRDFGTLFLVPTGCRTPRRLNPYETTVKLHSALPRDREKEANIYSQYQANAWVDRAWIRKRLPDWEGDPEEMDRGILDDARVTAAVKPTKQVAQTAGVGAS